ncbi:prephenate dehydratase [Bacillus horti]|uniref:Prephenate dehydratase n=1 Tax=Caldalkalibacillus horti TaxID=77523 RepID=A0ABT9VTE3_9BACI|nr:prephenate dehydratase [Bacillus horti]MDQ0164261.1 prephenate dehydratase [Bacillus horti]
MKIAYLGPRGTFTEQAVQALLAQINEISKVDQIEYIPKKTIPDCLVACKNKEVQYALVPIENSIEGSVNMTLDWIIHEGKIPIQAEYTLPIQQSALIHPQFNPASLDEVEKVFSHPQAIAQCHHFLREHCPGSEWIYMKSTAEAVEHVSKNPQEKWLAIGTSIAAKNYNLSIYQESIQDYDNNHTRFVLLGEDPLVEKQDFQDWLTSQKETESQEEDEVQKSEEGFTCKSSLLITQPENFPGTLYQVLAAFSWRRLDLTRIESRPTKKALGSYFFLIDLVHPIDDILLPGAIAEVEALGFQVRVLGRYPCFFKKR